MNEINRKCGGCKGNYQTEWLGLLFEKDTEIKWMLPY